MRTAASARRCQAAAGVSGEAALFARYVLGGEEPSPAALERYGEGCTALFAGPEPLEDLAVVEFAKRRPWSLPFLDAALALVSPQALLRRKLLLALAVLEATTAHAALFTPAPCPRPRLVARILLRGARCGLQALVGLLLLPLARRAR